LEHELDVDNGYWTDEQKPIVQAIENGAAQDALYIEAHPVGAFFMTLFMFNVSCFLSYNWFGVATILAALLWVRFK